MLQTFSSGYDDYLSATLTQYQNILGGYDTTETIATRRQLIATAGTLKNFRVKLNGSPGSGKSFIFTIVKNGIDTGLTVTIADTSTSGSDTTNTVSVSAGDLLLIKIAPVNTPNAFVGGGYSVQFEPTDSTKTAIPGGGWADGLSSSATEYNWLSMSNAWAATEADFKQVIPVAGTIRDLYVYLDSAPGSGKSYAFAVMKNGTASSLTTTIADTATTGSDTTNTVSVSAGDTVSIRVVPTGTPAIGYAYWGTVFVPDSVLNEFILMGRTGISVNSATRYFYFISESTTFASSEGQANYCIGQAMILENLRIKLETAPGAGTSYTITLRKNGASTPMAVTISGTDTEATCSAVVSVSAFDNLDWMIVPSGTPATTDIMYSVVGRDATVATKTFTADAFLKATLTKTFTADAWVGLSQYTKTFTADAFLKATFTKTFTADAILKATSTKTFSSDAILKGPPAIVSPKDAAVESSPVYMVATSSIYSSGTGGKKHFHLQIDKTSNQFLDIEAEANSFTSQTNWQYWDGAAWQSIPSDGLDSAYFGNNVRYQATLTASNKWWRIRELDLNM